MKKFTKVSLIIALIMAVVGMTCIISSVALGVRWETLSNMVREGKFSFEFGNIEANETSASLEDECAKLDIELGAGDLDIYYADVDHIQIEQDGVPAFKYYVEDETLHVEGNTKVGVSSTASSIAIVIPYGMSFDEVNLEVGAGEAEIEGLIANNVTIEVGLGEATVTNLDVQNLNAETGAGELYIELTDAEENYNYDIECGIGEIQVGDHSFGGLGSTRSITNPGASRFIDVECGIGEVEIDFKE